MNSKTLIPGIEFAIKHELTLKETIVLREFIRHATRTAQQIADSLETNKSIIHHDIQRLKLKHLVVLKDRDEKGTNLYELNTSEFKAE